MSERYSRPRLGGTFPVYASIHSDTRDRLEHFRTLHGLTVSGAVHHLLRLQLGLQPLRPLDTDS